MLKRPAILFVCLLLTGLFVLGLERLFELRFAQGDIYPPYSTLRADPLGASIFYESLGRIPGLATRRYFDETFKEDDGQGRALFILGAEPYSDPLPRSEFSTLQQFVAKGGRIVLAYFPEVSETWSSRRARTNDTASVKTNSASADDLHHYVNLSDEWGFHIDYKNLDKNDEGAIEFPDATLVASGPELPASMPIHTALFFTNLSNGWKTIYQRDRKTPVVIERKIGAGSIVLVADSYPLSNEAMFKERYSPLLAWLLGGEREAIFDEAHLGVLESSGVAALMRRYRLHGLVFSLILVAGLFVWKNSRSLVPPHAESESDDGPLVAGRDSASGFVNLLRRGVAPAEMINVCFAEWKKSGARMTSVSPDQWREIEQLVQHQAALAPGQRKPVENYRIISQILRRRK